MQVTLFFMLCFLPSIFGFVRPESKTFITSKINYPKSMFALRDVDMHSPILLENKINGLFNLTRIDKNFVPTSTLIFLCGYVANPDGISRWLQSSIFWSTFLTVHLITYAGMVLNDVFDINVDRINNSGRPLVNGSVEIEEAIGLALLMLLTVVFLGNKIMPHYLSPYWTSGILFTALYTPFLKRMFLMKNLSCASLVTLTVPFVSLSVLDPLHMWFADTQWAKIVLTVKMLFMSSMYIEIMQDITDVEGDKTHGIYTLPVVLGKRTALFIVFGMVFLSWINTVWNVSNSPITLFGMNLVFLPYFLNIWRTLRTNFSNNVIRNGVKQTTMSLIIYFILQLVS